jgi:hypothetical protein
MQRGSALPRKSVKRRFLCVVLSVVVVACLLPILATLVRSRQTNAVDPEYNTPSVDFRHSKKAMQKQKKEQRRKEQTEQDWKKNWLPAHLLRNEVFYKVDTNRFNGMLCSPPEKQSLEHADGDVNCADFDKRLSLRCSKLFDIFFVYELVYKDFSHILWIRLRHITRFPARVPAI